MKKAVPFLVVVAGVAFAVDNTIQKRNVGPALNDLPKPTKADNGSSQKAIEEMLKSLDKKTTKEKLESVYDCAVKTHEIGFPQSRSRPPIMTKKHDE